MFLITPPPYASTPLSFPPGLRLRFSAVLVFVVFCSCIQYPTRCFCPQQLHDVRGVGNVLGSASGETWLRSNSRWHHLRAQHLLVGHSRKSAATPRQPGSVRQTRRGALPFICVLCCAAKIIVSVTDFSQHFVEEVPNIFASLARSTAFRWRLFFFMRNDRHWSRSLALFPSDDEGDFLSSLSCLLCLCAYGAVITRDYSPMRRGTFMVPVFLQASLAFANSLAWGTALFTSPFALKQSVFCACCTFWADLISRVHVRVYSAVYATVHRAAHGVVYSIIHKLALLNSSCNRSVNGLCTRSRNSVCDGSVNGPCNRLMTYFVLQVLTIIIDFCSHQESLVIRAMAEVTTQR